VIVHGKRHHCLRPLSDAPDQLPSQFGTNRTGSARRYSASNGSTQGRSADAINRALVGLVRARAGRGPTKARTYLSADLAIVTLGDWLTPAEETLLSEGRRALARQLRTALHEGMRAEAVAAVERVTGRRVAAYLTAHQHDPDLAILAFHFNPIDGLDQDV
jgi:uncharacterized protein YbcI